MQGLLFFFYLIKKLLERFVIIGRIFINCFFLFTCILWRSSVSRKNLLFLFFRCTCTVIIFFLILDNAKVLKVFYILYIYIYIYVTNQ
ncbi:hypothetical protein C2G38_2097746 [Gigaspora rosea]|uniref:Uncharacterized protein n=1 Tax=Gigaspora rosea TaxID=44941 RepID=A0A397UWE9_9GLOM|nr:hypothetical protein C2G38_2097746 [Gigaspora rosea]